MRSLIRVVVVGWLGLAGVAGAAPVPDEPRLRLYAGVLPTVVWVRANAG